jgi:cytochrome c oxidase subunit 2
VTGPSAKTGWRTAAAKPVLKCTFRAAASAAIGLAVCLPPWTARAQGPMYYLETFGPRGDAIADLTWGLIALVVGVVIIISVLVLIGAFARRTRQGFDEDGRLPVTRSGTGLTWIYIGLALTTMALAGSATWTVVTMAAINQPPEQPRFTIEITGHQWWWQVRYIGENPSRIFETANELHVPVGEPVRFKLVSGDVIHSFWLPALSGKTDLIPGQTNVTWLQADEAGVYRGQCAEYCGQQHAHMALWLYADPPGQFQAWWDAQLEAASPPSSETEQTSQTEFILRCGACHTVRGTRAGGVLGPDLTHLMSRSTIAAGILPNTVGHLSGWVANPQYIKPGNKMPNLELSGPELDTIRSYLLTLD